MTRIYKSLFFPGKPGKTLHLLKASAKPIVPKKKRKIIPILGSLDDWQLV